MERSEAFVKGCHSRMARQDPDNNCSHLHSQREVPKPCWLLGQSSSDDTQGLSAHGLEAMVAGCWGSWTRP